MSIRYLGGFISATLNPLLQPSAPTIGTATAGNLQASVTFTASTSGSPTSYTAVSTPGGFTGTSTTSPITVSGLSGGTAYTFVVFANNQYGPSAASAASNSVTPTQLPTNFILQLDAANWNGTTWTATVGTNPTKNGTISASTINGFPCALFGSNGYFTIPNFVAPSSLSVFAVLNEPSGAPFLVEQSVNANANNGFYFYTDNSFPYDVYRSSVGTRLTFTGPGLDWFPPGFAMGATNFTGSAFTLRRNSTDLSTTDSGNISSYATSTNATDTLYIGCRAGNSIFFNGGSLCELIIAPTLNTTDFNAVTNYLTVKYGL